MKKNAVRMFAAILIPVILLSAVLVFDRDTGVAKSLNEMSLQDKITQMLMVSFHYWDSEPNTDGEVTAFTVMNDEVRRIVEDYNFGAVIYFAQNLEQTEQAFALTMELQQAATRDGGIPMFISADQEGGSVYRLNSGTALPGNMALGATNDPEYAKLAGQIIGSELSALGINTNLAPVVDVNNDANNPVIGLRSYSDDPVRVGNMAAAVISGVSEYNVISCVKHFPGHGDTATDSHYGLPVVDKSLEELTECELLPFRTAIGQDADMIMTAHILYPQLEKDTIYSSKTGRHEALPATMSDDIITGLLKEDMGFCGVVVSDAMNMQGITDYWDPVEAVIYSIQAGIDMICMPCTLSSAEDISQLDAIIAGVAAAVEDGTIPMSRIDDAVERILTVKDKREILDYRSEDYTLENAQMVVGSAANRGNEREIAAAAVTVVQNKDSTLPLKLNSNSKVLMLVPYNNEASQMIMGWNRAKEAGLIPDGAQVQVVRFDKESTGTTYKAEIDWADTLIFNSEISRAGMMNGGRWESAYILDVLSYAEPLGKTTVVQSVDKPYDVQSYPDADAVLAVYGCKGSSLDPTEALLGSVTASESACGPNITAGIEVMFGVYPAEGTLPIDVPKLEEGVFTDEIIFARGHGLTYDSVSGDSASS